MRVLSYKIQIPLSSALIPLRNPSPLASIDHRSSISGAIGDFSWSAAMSLRPSARTEVRRNRYKVAVDAEEGRRRREDNLVEIRKNKREESLQKKRREGLQAQQFTTPVSASTFERKVTYTIIRVLIRLIKLILLIIGFVVYYSLNLMCTLVAVEASGKREIEIFEL